jgi:hypothetical protein
VAINRQTILSPEVLIENIWTFSHGNGKRIAEKLRFNELGLLEDHLSDDEVAWNFNAHILKIFRRDGNVMWIADQAIKDEKGAWKIRLTGKHHPDTEVYLKQVLSHISSTSSPRRYHYTGAKRVLILRNGLDVERRLNRSLANAELFFIDNENDIESFSDCNIFISILALTHAHSPAQATAFIRRVTSRFPLAIFLELSGQSAAYLAENGLHSYHRGFDENALMDALNLDFVSDAAAPSGIFKIEHFVDGPAFDSFKGWIVSNDHPKGTFPTVKSRGAYQIFDRPVFEISVFACHGFEALDLPIQDDLTLLEVRTLRFRAQSSGFRVDRGDRVTHPRELGALLYNTLRDAPASWRDRPVSVPLLTEDHDKYRDPRHEVLLNKWRGEFKVETAEISVYELEDCVIGGTGTLFTRGQMVWGTDYLLIYLYSSKLDPIMRGLQRRHPTQHIDGVAICGFNSLYDNYYHWVAQAMVAISLCIDLLEKRNLQRITIVTGKLDSTRRAYLDLLLQGESRFRVVDLDRNEFVTADTVIYCDNVGRAVDPQICCEEISFTEKIIAATDLANVRPSRMLYIARTDTKARPMRNEQALIERLAGLGIEIFVGSQHSVVEQIRAFREARLIVAPHGAGLTNIMYSYPGTILLELQQSGYFNAGLMRLAQLANIRYYSEVFFPDVADSFAESWVVDVERVVEVVLKITGNAR